MKLPPFVITVTQFMKHEIVTHQLHNLRVEKFTKLCYNINDSYTTIQIAAAR